MEKGRQFSFFLPAGAIFMGAWRSAGTPRSDGRVFYSPDRFLLLLGPLLFTRPLLVEIVQNILGTHPQCVCCFPSNIIIKLPFSEVHPFTIVVLFLLGDLPDFINLFYI